MMEDDPAAARFDDLLADLPVRRDRGVRKRPEAVGQDIAAAQSCEHFETARRRVVEMGHDR